MTKVSPELKELQRQAEEIKRNKVERPDRQLWVGDKSYHILFSTSAQYDLDMYMAEQNWGWWEARVPYREHVVKPKRGEAPTPPMRLYRNIRRPDDRPFEAMGETIIPEWRPDSLTHLFARLQENTASLRDMVVLLWSALEGGRMKHDPERDKYTLKDAQEIIEGAGGVEAVFAEMMTAVEAASPEPKKKDAQAQAKKKKKSKGPTGGPTSNSQSESD